MKYVLVKTTLNELVFSDGTIHLFILISTGFTLKRGFSIMKRNNSYEKPC